ncbi:uncharacterized protein LOC130378539 [Gadus chalcogrammus]|uniref:uncharacterized protein LOC130378539 n=1 Tax=Gadus chalcogrammus TaxID=1042646 RepID=UPI0024C39A38|nr:uncharacterized protein LOC130378539 [Gadus chalcogrammus]
MQMQLDPSLQEDLQSVYAKILKLHFKRFPQPTENGTQSGDGVGMEGEQGMVPEEGADIEFVVPDIPYEDGNYDVVGQDDQGTQSGDGVGMEREQGMVPEEGAGTQSSDVVGMEREQEGRKENKDEKMVKSRRKRKHQTGGRCEDCADRAASGSYLYSKIIKRTKDQVLLQWLPCKKCGIKWKNTWEPLSYVAARGSATEHSRIPAGGD